MDVIVRDTFVASLNDDGSVSHYETKDKEYLVVPNADGTFWARHSRVSSLQRKVKSLDEAIIFLTAHKPDAWATGSYVPWRGNRELLEVDLIAAPVNGAATWRAEAYPEAFRIVLLKKPNRYALKIAGGNLLSDKEFTIHESLGDCLAEINAAFALRALDAPADSFSI
jgi:hypothetical protein